MSTHIGFSTSSFARIEGEAPISCHVVGDEAHLTIGGGALDLVITKTALVDLTGHLVRARDELTADEQLTTA
ncbi:hypothetical protein GCM10022243_13530 [Saccharothrix violaceirubra]|uniref:Uncharacterized protein n=1 Tax=Saccharothrix violaceirubra TaxID=413306 RepID=A0A7W7WUA2_9PSEU|nr:hypothetical protein [Saccharothrix violaceirubra]MBB4963527.1 hypothetical protein [Saccharothrix violaceirubra]